MSKFEITFKIEQDIEKLFTLLSGELDEKKTDRFEVRLKKSHDRLQIDVLADDLASMRAIGNKVLNLLAINCKADELLKE